MHHAAVKRTVNEDSTGETRAAIRLQSLARRRNARHKLANMKMLAPLLFRLQNSIDSQQLLFGSPIESPENLFQKIDKHGAGAVSMDQILDALTQLDIGMDIPGQRKRLMEVLSVDRSGSIDLREFKRG